jgi:hypothetical protein
MGDRVAMPADESCPHCGRPIPSRSSGVVATLSLSVAEMPALLAGIRREIARSLRRESEGEIEPVRRYAERVAAQLETGLGVE